MSVEVAQRDCSGERDTWNEMPLSHIEVIKALRGVFERQKEGEAASIKQRGREVLVLAGYANIIKSRLPLEVEPVHVAILAPSEYDPLTVVSIGGVTYLIDRDAEGLPYDIDGLRFGRNDIDVSYTPEFITEALSNVELSRTSAQAVAVGEQLAAGISPYIVDNAFLKEVPIHRSYGPGKPPYEGVDCSG